jgi:hypothetical protein
VLDGGVVGTAAGVRGGPVGAVGAPAVRPDEALGDQLLQRSEQRLGARDRQVGEVQLVEVDPVGAEPAQRVHHRPAQVRR